MNAPRRRRETRAILAALALAFGNETLALEYARAIDADEKHGSNPDV